MRTLLCAVNSKYVHSNPAVWSIYTQAREFEKTYGFDIGEIVIKEYTVNDVYENVLYDILTNKYDVIGFSVYIWNVAYVSRLTQDIKKVNPECIIIIGGPEVGYGTEHTSLVYDYVVQGEGERAFYALMVSLVKKENVKLPFEFQVDGKKVATGRIKDLASIPFIYNEENISRFDNRIIYYESSRGCPYSCAYCLSSVERGVRYLDLDRVFNDLSFFIKSGVKQVKFVDRTFNCDNDRAYKILSFIIENAKDKDINFHFEVGADLFTDKVLDLLAKAPSGLIQFEAGIQSTYEKALMESVRKTNLDRCFQNIERITRMGNIHMHVDLIAGLPYETLAIFKKSFNEAYLLYSHQLQLGFLKLLPGTRMNDMLEKHGYVFSEHPPYEILSSKYLSYDDLASLKRVEFILEKYYNSGRFYKTLRNLIEYFDTPFDMYEMIAEYFEKTNNLFRSISSRELYDILFEFVILNMPDKKDEFAHLMLFDYHASDSSNYPPKSLQYLWKGRKLSKDANMDKSFVNSVRFVGEEFYVFDYSGKNKVTGRYDLLKAEKLKINFC